MSKKNRNPNRQGFLNTVDTIKNAENDVDKVLQAARLKRHESSREPLKPSDIIKLCAIFATALVFCIVLVIGYLSGHFVPALLGVGAISFIGMMVIAGCS